jgi:hypothetical protein
VEGQEPVARLKQTPTWMKMSFQEVKRPNTVENLMK